MSSDIEISKKLEGIFDRLLKDIEKETGAKPAVSLCIFAEEDGGRMNYIANTERKGVILAMKSLIAAWESGMEDVKTHQVH